MAVVSCWQPTFPKKQFSFLNVGMLVLARHAVVCVYVPCCQMGTASPPWAQQ